MSNVIFNTVVREYRANINDLSLELLFVKSVRPPAPHANLSQFLHVHSYFEMFACTSGRMEIVLSDGVIVCEIGDIAVIPAGCRHISRRRVAEDATIGFVGRRCEGYGQESFFNTVSDILYADKPRVYRSCPDLCAEIKAVRDIAGGESAPEGVLFPVLRLGEILERMSSRTFEALGVGRLHESSSVSRDVGRFFRLEELINTRFTEPLDMDQVAGALYITRRHLDRIVKEHYGRTLRELVTEKRLMLACRLLEETDRTVSDVAERSGFVNGTVMRGVFLKHIGLTPGEYRKSKKT